jgi:hypothetical protein
MAPPVTAVTSRLEALEAQLSNMAVVEGRLQELQEQHDQLRNDNTTLDIQLDAVCTRTDSSCHILPYLWTQSTRVRNQNPRLLCRSTSLGNVQNS